jgi:hypothetical protein
MAIVCPLSRIAKCPLMTQSGHSVQRGYHGIGSLPCSPASVSVLETVPEFATDSSFAQTPNYVDSGAPPIKFSLRLSFGIIVRHSCFASGTTRHQKYPTIISDTVT